MILPLYRLCRLALPVPLMVVVGCAASTPPDRRATDDARASAGDSTAALLRVLADDFRRHLPPDLQGYTVDTADITLTALPSAVVQGLTWHVGEYRPPDTGDMELVAVAGWRNAVPVPIRTPGDWTAVVSASGWRPSTEDDVIDACEDLLRAVGVLRDPHWPPTVFRGDSPLPADVADAEAALSHLRAPEVRMEPDGGGAATLWAIERGRITRYRCEVDADASAALTQLASVPGIGFPRIGP